MSRIDEIQLPNGDTYEIGSLNTNNKLVAEAFDHDRTYEPGQLCVYHDTLYKSKYHQSGGFEPEWWDETDVETELKLKADKDEAISDISRIGTTFTATRADRTTFTFTQQDTTYSFQAGSTNGTLKITPSDSNTYEIAVVTGLGNAAYDNVVPFTHGGTGANSRLEAFKALNNSNVGTGATHFVTFASGWGSAGYSSLSNVRGLLNIQAGAPSTNSWWNNRAPIIASGDGVMEVGKIIDFHTSNNNNSDYTFRFNNTANNALSASGTITQGSSRKIKENIKPLDDEEALKILKIEPVYFDYKKEYGGKDHRGFIAEDIREIFPNLVTDEEGSEDDHKHFIPASLNYIEIIPYLTKLCQMQQKQIDLLSERVETLEKKMEEVLNG